MTILSLRRATSVALTALVLGAPAAAWAGGGAGDQQYQDPLAAPTAPKKPKHKVAPAPVASAPASSPAPAVSSAPATSSATPAASSRQLPRTGAPALLVGLSGATLILAGAALRRRTAAR